MFHDKPTPVSPSKGKLREKAHWQMGWWDFQPLAEQAQQSVDWSQSSVIFTAHPTRPLLTGRHFTSSKQFVVPSSISVISSPTSYDPPSIISVAPDDDWLFAYFPKHNNDGSGCLWQRGTQIDSWTVKEWWDFPQGGGVVAASWLGTKREWVTDHLGSASRLPPRGPHTPISGATLLLVTQDHQVNVCYFRHHPLVFKIISCSLTQPDITSESQTHSTEEKSSRNRRCFRAAIGAGYNETSVLIATKSSFLPPLASNDTRFHATHPGFMEVTQEPSLEIQSMEWESLEEESVINLCEIQLKFDGNQMILAANSLPPILHPGNGLINLKFITIPPSLAGSPNSTSHINVNEKKGSFYLAATYLNFGDYTSTPVSELTVYSISRQPHSVNSSSTKPVWIFRKNSTRSFFPKILTFIASSTTLTTSGSVLVYAGIVDTSGILPKSSIRNTEISIGKIKVLNLADLSDDHSWETSHMMSRVENLGQILPLNAAVSPNGALICTVSSSSWPLRTSIQLLPRRKKNAQISSTNIPPLAPVLVTAILSRRPAADVTHILSLPSTPINEAVDTLYHALHILDNHKYISLQSSTWGVLGEAMVIYKARTNHDPKDGGQELMTVQWKVFHDIYSLVACNRAFENCKREDTYDLDAVWQLVSLSRWIVAFTERVMKECIFSCNLEKQGPIAYPPILLLLAHPFALQHFNTALLQLSQFRAYVGSLSARGENAQIARDILIDLVDNSGINFESLITLVSECFRDSLVLNGDDHRRGLASCRPTTNMHPHLVKTIDKLIHSTILNKTVLFIKPSDLVDGVARLSITTEKGNNKDVVSKQNLVKTPDVTCLRCGGKSDVGINTSVERDLSNRWRVWEKMWTLHCICGGPWMRNTN